MHTGVKWNGVKCVRHHQLPTTHRRATESGREELSSHFVDKRSEEWADLEFMIGEKWPNHLLGTNFPLHGTWWPSCQGTIQIFRHVIGKHSHRILLHGQVCYKYLPIWKVLRAICTETVPMICTETSDKLTIATTSAQQEGKCRHSNQIL